MRLSFLPPWLPYAALGLALAFGVERCARYKAQLVEQGRMEERAKAAKHEADSLAVALAAANARQPRVDTAWLQAKQTSGAARDSLRLARTAADSLRRLLDIKTADEGTMLTCAVGRANCEERAVTAERLADAMQREMTARANTPVIRRKCGIGGALGYGATYGMTDRRIHTGPSATVGLSCSF